MVVSDPNSDEWKALDIAVQHFGVVVLRKRFSDGEDEWRKRGAAQNAPLVPSNMYKIYSPTEETK